MTSCQDDTQADEQQFQQQFQKLDVLIQAAEALSDAATRECMRELIRAVLDLHRDGLARLCEVIADTQVGDRGLLQRLADDSRVSSLLLLHELHPIPLEERIQSAIQKIEPLLARHACTIESLDIGPESVCIVLGGEMADSFGATHQLAPAIEEAIIAAAPELSRVEVKQPAGHKMESLFALPVLAR